LQRSKLSLPADHRLRDVECGYNAQRHSLYPATPIGLRFLRNRWDHLPDDLSSFSAVIETNKKAARQVRPFPSDLFNPDRAMQRERCLAGSAQIVSRRFSRAAICHDLVSDLLAFTQRAEAGALNGADVHEHVVAAVVRLNEAVALGCVKPPHGSHAHGGSPFSIHMSKPAFD